MAMTTTLLLLAALLLAGCRDRSATPIVLSAQNDSRDARNAPGEADARESGSATSEAGTQTQQVDLWDPNDDRNIAERLLERMKQEGVVRIVSVSASRDKYVFVGELGVSRQLASRLRSRKTDLWLVNKNGTGLRRLTSDGESYDPDWAPSGEEIAFISNGSVRIKGIETNTDVTAVYVGYMNSQPKFSPNGKAIAYVATDETSSWVAVAARYNAARYHNEWKAELCTFAKGFERHEWNSESELMLAYGKCVFDWDKMFIPSEGSDPKPDKAQPEKQVSEQFLNSVFKKVSAYGVIRIGEYSVAPSDYRIAFVGEFEEQGSSMRPKADLWIINQSGSGLRRLTKNHDSYEPVWSPSGKEIAFIHCDSVSVLNIGTGRARKLSGLQACIPLEDRNAVNGSSYSDHLWSPNSKVIAAIGMQHAQWITAVEAKYGKLVLNCFDCASGFEWNEKGELVVGTVFKFVFDWNSAIFTRYRREEK